ncbi:hypothetical protein SMICM304S_07908 [Streptomyces microflavus]
MRPVVRTARGDVAPPSRVTATSFFVSLSPSVGWNGSEITPFAKLSVMTGSWL